MFLLSIIMPRSSIYYGLVVTFQLNGWWLFGGPCLPSTPDRKRSLSDPVSLIEVLLSRGSCKGQHNSKIDPWTQRDVVLCPDSPQCHFIQHRVFLGGISKAQKEEQWQAWRAEPLGISLKTVRGQVSLQEFQDISDRLDLHPSRASLFCSLSPSFNFLVS